MRSDRAFRPRPRRKIATTRPAARSRTQKVCSRDMRPPDQTDRGHHKREKSDPVPVLKSRHCDRIARSVDAVRRAWNSAPMASPERLSAAFFARPAPTVAAELIGCVLTVDGVGGRIVETEAYAADDPASHSFNGPTPRNAIMFGPAARIYVYRIYGLHWCLNFTCGDGAAVLIRALEPTAGVDIMVARRGLEGRAALCSGPGKLCQALGIDGGLNGASIAESVVLVRGVAGPVAVGPRIGIARGRDTPWRFSHGGSPYLSRRSTP